MNRIKIYLDTSVISYLDQQDAPERMKETQEIWELFKKGQYEIYIYAKTSPEPISQKRYIFIYRQRIYNDGTEAVSINSI